jgi:hypothetical protein
VIPISSEFFVFQEGIRVAAAGPKALPMADGEALDKRKAKAFPNKNLAELRQAVNQLPVSQWL